MDHSFDVGSVVRLKLGGPTMTVEELTSSGELKCAWSGEEGQKNIGHFSPSVLELVEEGPRNSSWGGQRH